MKTLLIMLFTATQPMAKHLFMNSKGEVIVIGHSNINQLQQAVA